MPQWNFAGKESYFIMLVVQQLSQIDNSNMIYNEWGIIAIVEWFRSFKIRKELICQAFVLMPNHLQAIVAIEPPFVETHGRASLQVCPLQDFPYIQPLIKLVLITDYPT